MEIVLVTKMVQKKTIGIGVLLALLVGSGSFIAYQNLDFSKPQYYCQSKMDVGPMQCLKFSSTGVRCYPSTSTTKGYKDCPEGWTQIIPTTTTIINENAPTQIPIITTTIKPDDLVSIGPMVFLCGDGCTRIY